MYLAAGEKKEYTRGDKIGIVEITGVIASSNQYVKAIKQFRENDSVKSIVLRIDSPGGTVGPTQEIYAEVIKTAKIKTVVASLGSVAASGGYYIASAASGIVTNPGTLTGSIGVVMGFTNMEELMDKIGLKPMIIKSGEYKAMGSPFKEMTPNEQNLFEEITGNIHKQFIRHVAEGRKMSMEEVEKIADGRVFTGNDALTLGLCDRLGNIEDAFNWAAELSGIDKKAQRIYPKEESDFPFFDKLIKSGVYSLMHYIEEIEVNSIAPMFQYRPDTP